MRALRDLFRHRFVVPERKVSKKAEDSYQRKGAAARRQWRLEDSIWQDRPKYNDSQSFYDTSPVKKQLVDNLFDRAIKANFNRLASFILKKDGESGESDGDENDAAEFAASVGSRKLTRAQAMQKSIATKASVPRGSQSDPFASGRLPQELDEVRGVLRRHIDLIYASYDYYAAVSSETTGTFLSTNGFSQFVEDCQLVSSSSKHSLGRAHFDQLFIAVNVTLKGGEVEVDASINPKNMLNRREWCDVLIRVAIMYHLIPGDTPDVSDALEMLFTGALSSHLPLEARHDGNSFRARFCYIESVDRVLRRHESTLRALFSVYAYSRDHGLDALKSGLRLNPVDLDHLSTASK